MIVKLSSLTLSIFSLVLYGCTSELIDPATASRSASVEFAEEVRLGDSERNPSTPFLRYAPDGRLFAVWTEEHDKPWPNGRPTGHQHGGDRAASPLRNVMVAASIDSGKTWSAPRRVNSAVEAVQGEENGPKIAVGADKRAYIVWSIPGEKGDKTRANIRFAMDDGNGGFTPAQTLNEVKDAGRFPIIEMAPDGNLLIAWIDRRVDGPNPRQLYLMRLNPNGQTLTKNYQVGEDFASAASWASHSLMAARQSIWLTARWMAKRFAITCCESPPTAAQLSARQLKLAMMVGRFPPAPIPVQASAAIVATNSTSVGLR